MVQGVSSTLTSLLGLPGSFELQMSAPHSGAVRLLYLASVILTCSRA